MITTRISVDFALPNMGARVEAMQGDGATRTVAVTLRANGLRWEPPAGVDAALAYRQPDDHKGIYDKLADDSAAITVSGNVASVVLIPQMLTVPGDVQCQLIFNDSKLDRLTSFPFVLKVTRNEIAGAAPVQDYIRLQWMEDKLDELLRKAADSGAFRGEKGDQGPQGEPGVSTKVNGIAPDETGTVTLTAADVGALPSAGGDMTGAINMNGQSISGLNDPTEESQAARKGYVDAAKTAANAYTDAAKTAANAYTDAAKTAANAYTDASVRKAAPRNLLDNSDFRNPVNQRGQTSWNANGYTIDRWLIYHSDGTKRTVSLSDEGLTCNYGGVLRQIIPKNIVPYNLNEAAFTFAMWRADGTVIIKNSGMWTDGSGNYVLSLDAGTWAHVALYEGTYTAETLPEYHPKGYRAELLECQRYYYKLLGYWKYISAGICVSATEANIPVYLPQAMRVKPTITITDSSKVKVACGSLALQVPSKISWDSLTTAHDGMQMTATIKGATAGSVAMLYLDDAGYIELSADL